MTVRRIFSALQVLLAHEEVERHGDQEATEAEEDLVEVGLDEEPEADEDGSGSRLRRTRMARQVGTYWAKRETTLMAAKVVKLPDRAMRMPTRVAKRMATYGVWKRL